MKNRIKDIIQSSESNKDLYVDISEHAHEFFDQAIDFDFSEIEISEIIKDVVKLGQSNVRNVSLKKVAIKNLRNPRYELTEELLVHLEEENDSITAISYDIGQYGQGVSEEEAIQDLCEIIVEYYKLLSSEKKKLSKQLKTHLNYLKKIIKEV